MANDSINVREPLTPARLAEIRALAASLQHDAEYDIEDKRDIYCALMDLLEQVIHVDLTMTGPR